MPLEREREYYLAHRAELLEKYKDMFVLIKEDRLIGAYPDAEAAYAAGLSQFGGEPFLIRQVLAVEPTSISHLYSALAPRANL